MPAMENFPSMPTVVPYWPGSPSIAPPRNVTCPRGMGAPVTAFVTTPSTDAGLPLSVCAVSGNAASRMKFRQLRLRIGVLRGCDPDVFCNPVALPNLDLRRLWEHGFDDIDVTTPLPRIDPNQPVLPRTKTVVVELRSCLDWF